MTTDLSNKGLAVILLVALVVLIGSSLFTFNELGITGFSVLNKTAAGNSNFSINGSLSIKFNGITTVPFGFGYVNSSMQNCTIGTNMSAAQISAPTSGCIGFNTTVGSMNLTIENDGNVPCNVSLNFTSNATGFINGTSPSYKYMIVNNETGSCFTIMNGSTWTEVGLPNTYYTVCKNLSYSDTNDTFQIPLLLQIPSAGVPTGGHLTTIVALGCDDGSC